MPKLMPFLFLFFSSQYSAVADITFTEKDNSEISTIKKSRGAEASLKKIPPTEPPKLKTNTLPDLSSKEKSLKELAIPQKIKTTGTDHYEIEGYVNSNKVRIVIEVDKNQKVVGNMYDDNGMETYMHGEYINGAFELYDQKGEHYRVLMAD